MDVADQEGHRPGRLLPLLLPMVDPGHIQSHFPAPAGSLSAARSHFISQTLHQNLDFLNLFIYFINRKKLKKKRYILPSLSVAQYLNFYYYFYCHHSYYKRIISISDEHSTVFANIFLFYVILCF